MNYLNNQVITNRESNFGLSYRKLQKQFFKEFQVELMGKDSPGPGLYTPNLFLFNNEKHDSKSFPLEKRECPLVPREAAI
jgi:hypothetical protein